MIGDSHMRDLYTTAQKSLVAENKSSCMFFFSQERWDANATNVLIEKLPPNFSPTHLLITRGTHDVRESNKNPIAFQLKTGLVELRLQFPSIPFVFVGVRAMLINLKILREREKGYGPAAGCQMKNVDSCRLSHYHAVIWANHELLDLGAGKSELIQFANAYQISKKCPRYFRFTKDGSHNSGPPAAAQLNFVLNRLTRPIPPEGLGEYDTGVFHRDDQRIACFEFHKKSIPCQLTRSWKNNNTEIRLRDAILVKHMDDGTKHCGDLTAHVEQAHGELETAALALSNSSDAGIDQRRLADHVRSCLRLRKNSTGELQEVFSKWEKTRRCAGLTSFMRYIPPQKVATITSGCKK